VNLNEKLTEVLKYTDYEEAIVIGSIFGELQQENTQLKSDLQALRERLRCIEWVYDEDGDKCFCPACEGTSTFVGVDPESTGHYDNCWLKAEIDKTELGKLKGDE